MRAATVGVAFLIAMLAAHAAAQPDTAGVDAVRTAAERALAGGDAAGAFATLDAGRDAATQRADVAWMRALGRAAMGTQRFARAREVFEWVAGREDATAADWVHVAWARFEAAAALEESDPAFARAGLLDAADAAKQAIALSGADTGAWRFLGAALTRAGERGEADRAYADGIAAVQKAGGDPTPLVHARIDALVASQRVDDAHAVAKSLADPVSAALATARVWAGAGRDDRAVEALATAIERAPNDRRIYDALWASLGTANPGRGAALVGAVAEKHPDAYLAHAYLGKFLVASADFDGAERAFARCREIAPDDAWARYAQADLAQRRLGALEANPKSDPVAVQAGYSTAVALWLDYLDHAKRTNTLDPTAVATVDLLIYNQARAGLDPEAAYPAYKRFVELFPDRHLHWAVFAAICQDAGRLEEAEAAIARAIRDCPDAEAARRTQYINDRGLLYEAGEQWDKAKASYREASGGEGKGKADGFENLARLHFKLGNTKAAVACFKQVLELEPDRTQAIFYYHLCRRALARKHHFEAK